MEERASKYDVFALEKEPRYAHFEESRKIIEMCKKKAKALLYYTIGSFSLKVLLMIKYISELSEAYGMAEGLFAVIAIGTVMVAMTVCCVFVINKSKIAHYFMIIIYLLFITPQLAPYLSGELSLLTYTLSFAGIFLTLLSLNMLFKYEELKDKVGFPYFNVRFAAQEEERRNKPLIREYADTDSETANQINIGQNFNHSYTERAFNSDHKAVYSMDLNSANADKKAIYPMDANSANAGNKATYPMDVNPAFTTLDDVIEERADSIKREWSKSESVIDKITNIVDPSSQKSVRRELDDIKPPQVDDIYDENGAASRTRYNPQPLPALNDIIEK